MQSLLTGASVGVVISILVLVILYTNQLNEFKRFMPIAELDFSDNELYKINSAKIYATGKGVAPNEKLQLMVDIINEQDFTLTFRSDIRVSIGGEPGNHIANRDSNDVDGKSSKDIAFDFYLADEGPNEISVLLKPYFPNGTLIETKPASITIDVVSLSNQLQLEQNKYTSYGVIVSAIIGIATIIALIASLYFSQKEIKNLESQNELFGQQNTSITEQTVALQEQNTTLKEQASIQNRPWLSLIPEHAVSKKIDFFQIQFRNYGKSVATNVTILSWAKDGNMTETELIQNGTTYPKFDVSPDEIFSHILPISNALSTKANGSNDVSIGLIVKYEFEQTKQGQSILIGNWNPSLNKLYYKIKNLK